MFVIGVGRLLLLCRALRRIHSRIKSADHKPSFGAVKRLACHVSSETIPMVWQRPNVAFPKQRSLTYSQETSNLLRDTAAMASGYSFGSNDRGSKKQALGSGTSDYGDPITATARGRGQPVSAHDSLRQIFESLDTPVSPALLEMISE
jgi:hypothetical protein